MREGIKAKKQHFHIITGGLCAGIRIIFGMRFIVEMRFIIVLWDENHHFQIITGTCKGESHHWAQG